MAITKAQPLCRFSTNQLDTVELTSEEGSFCLVNQGRSFILEGLEDLPLQNKRLHALLELLENFPTGVPAKLSNDFSPDLIVEITPINGAPTTLELFYIEEGILISNGIVTQRFSPDKVSSLLQRKEDYADTSVIKMELPAEGNVCISGQIHPQSLSFRYMDNKAEGMLAHLIEPFDEVIPFEQMELLLNSLSDLRADSVVCLKPSEKDLSIFGLDDPFLTLFGEFQGKTLSLTLSQPEGNYLYIRKNEEPVIYSIELEKLPWLTFCAESLTEKELFSADYNDCTKLTISAEGKTYRFTKWDGTVLCGGKQISENDFANFFSFSTRLISCGAALHTSTETEPLLALTLSYTNPEQPSDVIQFFPYNQHCLLLSINGDQRFLCEKDLASEIFHRCEVLLR